MQQDYFWGHFCGQGFEVGTSNQKKRWCCCDKARCLSSRVDIFRIIVILGGMLFSLWYPCMYSVIWLPHNFQLFSLYLSLCECVDAIYVIIVLQENESCRKWDWKYFPFFDELDVSVAVSSSVRTQKTFLCPQNLLLLTCNLQVINFIVRISQMKRFLTTQQDKRDLHNLSFHLQEDEKRKSYDIKLAAIFVVVAS